MDKKTFTQRIRQLHAMDKNAEDIYKALVQRSEDPLSKDIFSKIAIDETRHTKMSLQILSSLEGKQESQ